MSDRGGSAYNGPAWGSGVVITGVPLNETWWPYA